MTRELFREDAYLAKAEATVTQVSDVGIQLDQTVFYPMGGGQPGDVGVLTTMDGRKVAVVDTQKTDAGHLHLTPEPHGLSLGDLVTMEIDWNRRHRLMRMHSALHLLCSVVSGGVTGGQVGTEKGRLDFDIDDPGTLDKAAIEAALNDLVARDYSVSTRWIEDTELDSNPELVRTLSVQPPRGTGKVRLIDIDGTDLQPCGGTHVRRTGEIGRLRVGKIENKGKRNRRINLHFVE